MKKIITAMNNPELNNELKNEKDVELMCKDILYREGIIEVLEKNNKVEYLIFDEKLPGEIGINDLIEKILEKNEKIKIIITIKNENKNIIKINNKKIIKIFYDNTINLEKIKNYKKTNDNKYKNIIKKNDNINYKEEINNIRNIKKDKKDNKNNKKNEEGNKKDKIITILGDRNIGKSITIISIIDYIIKEKNKNSKILIIDMNEESPNIYSIFGTKKFNKIKVQKRRKIKKYVYKEKIKFKEKYLNEKILDNLIIRLSKNINILSKNKLIRFSNVKYFKKYYDYLLIEIYSNKNKKIINKIINNSNKNIILLKPNLTGIKNCKKIIEKNKLNKKNNYKIIINNYNNYSINEDIIKNIFDKNKVIGKIKYNDKYENIINNYNYKKTNKKNNNKIYEIIIK